MGKGTGEVCQAGKSKCSPRGLFWERIQGLLWPWLLGMTMRGSGFNTSFEIDTQTHCFSWSSF